jgi:hypothetical protein
VKRHDRHGRCYANEYRLHKDKGVNRSDDNENRSSYWRIHGNVARHSVFCMCLYIVLRMNPECINLILRSLLILFTSYPRGPSLKKAPCSATNTGPQLQLYCRYLGDCRGAVHGRSLR